MKNLSFVFVAMFIIVQLNAQPVITSSFNPVPGDLFKFHPATTIIEPGSAGANVTWDYSNIGIVYNPQTGRYIDPAITPFDTSFPAANVVYEDHFAAGTFHYYATDNNEIKKLGYASVLLTAVYDSPYTLYTYPFTYNTVVTDNFTCTTEVGAIDLIEQGTWEAEGDAYGTLILPSGTHNDVLRIKITNVFSKEYTGVPKEDYEITEYLWVTPTSKIPLLKLKIDRRFVGGNPTDTLISVLISDDVSSIDEQSNSFANLKLYPNPASTEINVDFVLQNTSVVRIEVLSADGRLVKQIKAAEHQPGKIRETITIDDLTSGLYMVNIIAGDTMKTKKFIKN